MRYVKFGIFPTASLFLNVYLPFKLWYVQKGKHQKQSNHPSVHLWFVHICCPHHQKNPGKMSQIQFPNLNVSRPFFLAGDSLILFSTFWGEWSWWNFPEKNVISSTDSQVSYHPGNEKTVIPYQSAGTFASIVTSSFPVNGGIYDRSGEVLLQYGKIPRLQMAQHEISWWFI